MALKLTDATFNEVVANNEVVLVDFSATWCGPCRMQSPIIDELDEEMDEVSFYKMNVDEEQQTASQFGIMSIPTLLIKKDGEVVEKLIGVHDKNRLTEILAQYK